MTCSIYISLYSEFYCQSPSCPASTHRTDPLLNLINVIKCDVRLDVILRRKITVRSHLLRGAIISPSNSVFSRGDLKSVQLKRLLRDIHNHHNSASLKEDGLCVVCGFGGRIIYCSMAASSCYLLDFLDIVLVFQQIKGIIGSGHGTFFELCVDNIDTNYPIA
jgi:hypothetical protein